MFIATYLGQGRGGLRGKHSGSGLLHSKPSPRDRASDFRSLGMLVVACAAPQRPAAALPTESPRRRPNCIGGRVPEAASAANKSDNVASPMQAPKPSKESTLDLHAIARQRMSPTRKECNSLCFSDLRSIAKHNCSWRSTWHMGWEGKKDSKCTTQPTGKGLPL